MRHAPYPITQRAPILTSPRSVAVGAMTAEGSMVGRWLPLFSSIETPWSAASRPRWASHQAATTNLSASAPTMEGGGQQPQHKRREHVACPGNHDTAGPQHRRRSGPPLLCVGTSRLVRTFATFPDFLIIALTLPRAAWADTAARTCKDRWPASRRVAAMANRPPRPGVRPGPLRRSLR